MPQPTPASGGNKPRAIDLFTDREQPQQLFEETRAGLAPDQYRILVFYGVGGQGKTLLCEKLRLNLQQEQPHRAVWGLLDLYPVDFRESAHGLLQLRKSLGESGRIKFTAFDYAIATYWEKAYPTENIEVALQGVIAQYVGELSDAAEDTLDLIDVAVPETFKKGAKYLWKKGVRKNAERVYPALCGLQQREQWEILQDLPMFFGWDLRAHGQGKNALQPIIFIDTYEALWTDKQTKTGLGATETDAWLRRLVAESPGVLFVILGRDKLTWDERFPRDDWGAFFNNQHLLGGLSDADAESYLKKIPVAEPDIRRVIIEAAKGEALSPGPSPAGGGEDKPLSRRERGWGEGGGALPFYLDIEAQTYQKILAQGQKPKPEDFGGTYAQIIDRFLRYADKVEREILKLLSAPRSFDPVLFDALAQHYRIHTLPNTYQELTGYSFIECGSDGRCRLHGLMRDHLYAELDEPAQTALEQFLFDWYDQRCQPASPKDVSAENEIALREAVYHRDVREAEQALAWFWTRWDVFYEAARYAAIEPLNRWALNLAEELLGTDHTETATTLNNFAELLRKTNRMDEAETLIRRALEIDEKAFGPKHPTVATNLNNLALLLQTTNRLAEAEPLMRRALAIDEDSLGPEHPDVARDLNNLALLLKCTNRLVEAEPLLRRVVGILENPAGDPLPNCASVLNNLATLLGATNRLAEAEPLLRRALAIDEASFGLEHPDVARDLNNLAQLLQDTNRLAEAEPLLRRALAIDEASFAPDHPSVAIGLNNLAQLLQDTNRLAEAEPLMRQALEIDEASLGPEHPDVARDLNNLALLLKCTNRLAEAEPLLRRALAIKEASYGPEHPNVAISLNNLATLLQATNRLAEAEPLLRRALSIFEASFGPDHPKIAICLNGLATLLRATNRPAEAEPLMRRALAIDEASYGPGHPEVAIGLNNLALLLMDMNRLEEAEPLQRRALAITENSLGPEHPKVGIRLKNIARLLKETDRANEAEPILRRALVIFLKFTHASGHEHPKLREVFGQYRQLLQALSLNAESITQRIKSLAAESGFDDDGWQRLLAQISGDESA